jgi:hypothetical protein
MKLVRRDVKTMRSIYQKDRSADIKIAPMTYLFGMTSYISAKDALMSCQFGIALKRLVNNARTKHLTSIRHQRNAKHAMKQHLSIMLP